MKPRQKCDYCNNECLLENIRELGTWCSCCERQLYICFKCVKHGLQHTEEEFKEKVSFHYEQLHNQVNIA